MLCNELINKPILTKGRFFEIILFKKNSCFVTRSDFVTQPHSHIKKKKKPLMNRLRSTPNSTTISWKTNKIVAEGGRKT